tara:strand:- start:385 stop:1254 length:870 start_codon:yes stop_codon:yes gene_type:complete
MSNEVEEEIEIEIEGDEEPKQEASEPEVEIVEEPVAADPEELDEYSKGVQKRIRQLNQRYRDEQVSREEATKVAQKLAEQNQQLQARVQQLDSGYLNEYGNRVQSETSAAEKAYLQAADEGDTEAMLAAQKALNKAQYDESRFAAAKQRVEQQAQQPMPQQQPAPQQQQAPQVDPKADAWAKKNTWFGEDDVMTASVFAIHNRMVTQEGFDPTSEDYYTEVDRRMRSEFPNKFAVKKSGGGAQVASAASSASRNTNQKRTKSVRLTQRQVIMAKKLNVPLAEYAKFVKD